MNKILTNKLIVLFLLVVNICLAQNLTKITLTNKLQVLNGKAFFNFPNEAREEARSESIMAAPKNPNEETRIIYDNGEKRVVFFAQELFKIADDNLFDEVSKGKGEILSYRRKILTDKDSIYSILSTPIKPNEGKYGMLINSLIVKVQDGTLFRINAHISPEAYSEKEKYMEFTENVFKTLSQGYRNINLKARTEYIKLELGYYNYQIHIPENYAYTVDYGVDFKVTKFHKYTKFNTPDQKITIYSGNHASRFYRQYNFKDPYTIVKGTFLKQEIDWYLYVNKESNFFLKEEVISLPGDMDLHIAMTGYTSESIDELTKIQESLKFIE